MAKKRRPRPGDKAGRVIVVVVIVLVAVLLTGGTIAGVVYVLNRSGFFNGTGPGGGLFMAGFQYANTNDGLEKETADLLAERQAGGDDKIKEAAKLPEKWFVDAFGEAQGKEYYVKYNAGATTSEQDLQQVLDTVIHYGPGKVHARVLEERLADPLQRRVFFAMQKTAPPLYAARVDTATGMQAYVKDLPPPSNGTTSVEIQDFVYADGAWRFFAALRLFPQPTGR